MNKLSRLVLDLVFIACCTTGIIYGALYFIRDLKFLDLVFINAISIASVPLIMSLILMLLASFVALSTLFSIIFFFRRMHWGWSIGNGVGTIVIIIITIYVALVYYKVDLPLGINPESVSALIAS